LEDLRDDHFMDTKSAARTLDTFEAFANAKRPLTLTELAKELDSPISSCFQLVKTLERRGYMFSLGPRKGMYPTKRMLHSLEAISRHDPLKLIFQDALTELQSRSQETAVLGQQVDERVAILDAQESPQRVRYSPEIGEFHEFHSTAIGKAILGAMTKKERGKILSKIQLERFTDKTVIDRDALEEELERSRVRGWYVTKGENIPDLCAVAVPVRINGQVFAIALGGPFHRFITEVHSHAMALMEVVSRLEVLD
jgi:IclR family acetate operon transcriptional repressor